VAGSHSHRPRTYLRTNRRRLQGNACYERKLDKQARDQAMDMIDIMGVVIVLTALARLILV
jgi:hypothetical protein